MPPPMKSNGREEDGVSLSGVLALRRTPSGKALVCRIPQEDEVREVCVPISHITDDSEVWKPGDEGELVITAWLAMRQELR